MHFRLRVFFYAFNLLEEYINSHLKVFERACFEKLQCNLSLFSFGIAFKCHENCSKICKNKLQMSTSLFFTMTKAQEINYYLFDYLIHKKTITKSFCCCNKKEKLRFQFCCCESEKLRLGFSLC